MVLSIQKQKQQQKRLYGSRKMNTLFHTQLKRNELLKTELLEKVTIYFHNLLLSHQVLQSDVMFSFYLNLYPYLFLSVCPEI